MSVVFAIPLGAGFSRRKRYLSRVIYRQFAISFSCLQRNELDEHQTNLIAAFALDADTAVKALIDHYR